MCHQNPLRGLRSNFPPHKFPFHPSVVCRRGHRRSELFLRIFSARQLAASALNLRQPHPLWWPQASRQPWPDYLQNVSTLGCPVEHLYRPLARGQSGWSNQRAPYKYAAVHSQSKPCGRQTLLRPLRQSVQFQHLAQVDSQIHLVRTPAKSLLVASYLGRRYLRGPLYWS